MRTSIHHGANLLAALRLARRLGCLVAPRRRTGELVVIGRTGRCTLNRRRKDAPRILIRMLRKELADLAKAA
jgi:hypothetical protein